MKLIKKYNDVNFLGLIDNQMVLRYPDRIEIGTRKIPVSKDNDLVSKNNLIFGKENGNEVVYINGNFTTWPQCRFPERMLYSLTDSSCYDNGYSKFSVYNGDKEIVLEIKSEKRLRYSSHINIGNDTIFMLTYDAFKHRVFYSKTGELLWQYTEEAEDLKINWSCIPIVDDVVVIISQKRTAAMKLRGFNIRTGELLWTLDRKGRACPNTFFVGEDKMLYGCNVYYADTVDLNLCKLNPFTGQLETWSVLSESDLEVMSWLVTMHGRRLYYTDNRKGKEFGVIDVDRKEIVCRQPLEIKKNVTLDAPVVTDDRMYVYIRELNELRVYEL